MTNEEAIEVLAQDLPCETDEDLSEAMTMAIKALEQQPCEDAISRQAVLDIVNNPLNIRLDEIIKKLPPVTPQPKTGHWIRQDNTKEPLYGWYFCSECNSVIGDKTKFCSNCGAKMESEE